MDKKGLTKLIEECGELVQIAAKKSAYMDVDLHPDGKGSMKMRLEDELADVEAASQFVIDKFKLNEQRIQQRAIDKLMQFTLWGNT